MKVNDVVVNFDTEMLEEMNLEGVMLSPVRSDVGVAVFSEVDSVSMNPYVVRIYMLGWDQKESKYLVVNELQAFSFTTQQRKDHFVKNLPMMSALDLLMLLNPKGN